MATQGLTPVGVACDPCVIYESYGIQFPKKHPDPSGIQFTVAMGSTHGYGSPQDHNPKWG